MKQTELHQLLTRMRQQYIEGCEDQPVDGVLSKEMEKIKQKIVGLETERCQRMVEHADVSAVNEKIVEQKKLFQELAAKK